MERQIVKGFTMLMLIVALSFVSAVVSVNGQTPTIAANIPFEFNVGDETLPSGAYTVKAATATGSALLIKGQDSKAAAMRLAHFVEASKAPEKAKLVFHRYGQRAWPRSNSTLPLAGW